MSFNSLQFLIYLPVVVGLYWILPQRARWVLLLIASYYFYMSWNPELIFLIVFTTLISYLSGILIEKFNEKKAKKAITIMGVALCVGVLVVFKYLNFFLESVYAVIRLFMPNFSGKIFDLILPIGISFYTFQTLSYIIDVYRGTIKAERHLGYYALFVVFFPQLVAGPIERPGDLLPQLKSKQTFTWENFEMGIRFLISGFIKKVVIADYFGTMVGFVYSDLETANGLAIVIATTLFYVQLYCDFSGYTDIAMGCGRLLGIRLTQNFIRPFMATSFHDFWKRWHLSLTRWFNDYIYFPLGGSKKGKLRSYINIFIVFALSGLWHGANWTFVIWGLSGAFFQIAENLLKPLFRKLSSVTKIPLNCTFMLWVRRIFVFGLGVSGSFFFRAASLHDVGIIFSSIFTGFLTNGFDATLNSLHMTSVDIMVIALEIIVFNMLWRLTLNGEDRRTAKILGQDCKKLLCRTQTVEGKYLFYFTFILVISIAWLMAVSSGDTSAFVYFQF